jgi:hypothetical protein
LIRGLRNRRSEVRILSGAFFVSGWRRSSLASHCWRRCVWAKGPRGRGVRITRRVGLASEPRLGLGSAEEVLERIGECVFEWCFGLVDRALEECVEEG